MNTARLSLTMALMLLCNVSVTSQSGAGKPIHEFSAFCTRKENDLHLIRVGNERYEIPDAVVLGG